MNVLTVVLLMRDRRLAEELRNGCLSLLWVRLLLLLRWKVTMHRQRIELRMLCENDVIVLFDQNISERFGKFAQEFIKVCTAEETHFKMCVQLYVKQLT